MNKKVIGILVLMLLVSAAVIPAVSSKEDNDDDVKSSITTIAPSPQRVRAVARPMPRAAPVTIATFPSKFRFMCILLLFQLDNLKLDLVAILKNCLL